MADDRFQRLQAYFEKALDRSPAERDRFLRDNCADDPSLEAELRQMLAQADAGTHLNDLIAEAAVRSFPEARNSLSPGTMIGNFRLEKLIGSGGMGDVFEALQLQPVERRVAIKLIKLGMHTPEVLSRFESERQTLAMMSHPCIAAVFDAGTTDTGQPYFVMEFVEGVAVNEYCDAHHLDLPARIALFLKICEGVQHAHQKGIIHRDLKPSNVLVTEIDGTAIPKIIDFGVAKAVSQPLAQQTAYTQLGQLIGTPEYMSPEQADLTSVDIDTRSDVYSLGVIFYEIITGTRPFEPAELRAAGFEEILRIIREVEPPLPSTRLVQLGRTTHSAETLSRARQLTGDLDWITVRAMEKDRARRYASASELISDIRRYQRNEPVLASPPELNYRIRKFIRRHRVGVSLSATAVTLLLLGIVGTGVGLIRAMESERAAAESARTAEQTVAFMKEMFSEADPASARGETITVKEVLDSGVAKIRAELADEPAVRFSLLETMADVYVSLGLLKEARPLYEEALLMLRETPQASASNNGELNSYRMRRALASLEIDLGDAATAQEMFLQLLAEENRLGPDHIERIRVLNGLAGTQMRLAQYDRAVTTADQALSLLAARPDGDAQLKSHLINVRGYAQEELGHFPAAIEDYRESIRLISAAVGEDHPDTFIARSALARTLSSAGQLEDAEQIYLEVLQQQQRVMGEKHLDTGVTMANLGSLLRDLGRYQEAEEYYNQAVDILTGQLGPDHPWVRATQNNIAQVYHDQGRWLDAEVLYKKLMLQEARLLAPDNPERAYVINNLGMLYHSMGRLDEAEVMLVEAHEIRRAAFGEMHPIVAAGYVNVGRILRYQQKDREAVEMFEKALEINRQLLDANHPDIGRGLKELGALYLSSDELEPATQALEEAVAIFHEAYPEDYYEVAEAESYLGAVRLAQGNPEAAEPLLLSALESLLNGEDRDSKYTRDTLQRLIELYESTGKADAVRKYQQQLESIRDEQKTLS